MIINKIKEALLESGIHSLPADPHENLENYGMDSLVMVLSVSALEKKLNIKIPASKFSEEKFKSLHTIQKFVTEV